MIQMIRSAVVLLLLCTASRVWAGEQPMVTPDLTESISTSSSSLTARQQEQWAEAARRRTASRRRLQIVGGVTLATGLALGVSYATQPSGRGTYFLVFPAMLMIPMGGLLTAATLPLSPVEQRVRQCSGDTSESVSCYPSMEWLEQAERRRRRVGSILFAGGIALTVMGGVGLVHGTDIVDWDSIGVVSLAVLSVGLTGVGLGMGQVLSSRPVPVRISPVVGPSGGGVSISGRF
jgi:peptidoglycan/LPS O-acetylase OafA/YrhL